MGQLSGILQRYADGHLTKDDLVNQLAAFDYQKPLRYSTPPLSVLDTYESEGHNMNEADTWDQVRRANVTGLIDNQTYMAVVNSLRGQPTDATKAARRDRFSKPAVNDAEHGWPIEASKQKFSDNQDRDDHGRWTSGGGYGSFDSAKMTVHDFTQVRDQTASALVPGAGESSDFTSCVHEAALKVSERLRGNADWQTLRDKVNENPEMYGTVRQADPDVQAAQTCLSVWADTSGDSDPLACAMQNAVNEQFGLGAPTDHMLGMPAGLSQYSSCEPGLRTFVQAQYDETQSYLQSQGVTELLGYRGAVYPQGSPEALQPNGEHEVSVDLQPASSFSSDAETATTFARLRLDPSYRQVLEAKIPAARVFSTWKTGFGTSYEREFTVLGGKNLPMRATGALGYPESAPSVQSVLAMPVENSAE